MHTEADNIVQIYMDALCESRKNHDFNASADFIRNKLTFVGDVDAINAFLKKYRHIAKRYVEGLGFVVGYTYSFDIVIIKRDEFR